MKAEGRNLENPGESQHPCAQHLPNVRLHASDATVLQELLRPGTGALRLCFAALLLFAWAVPQLPAATMDPSSANPFVWPDAISISRPWAYWWWMGSAVNPADLSRELERYHQAGLGGVHIIPIYGAKGYETQSIEYLGPRWLEMLRHTVTEAHRLGMGVDMTLGTGWCFGGPNITAADANARAVVKTFTAKAGERLNDKFDRRSTQALAAFSDGDYSRGQSRRTTLAISARDLATDRDRRQVAGRISPRRTEVACFLRNGETRLLDGIRQPGCPKLCRNCLLQDYV